MTRATHPNSPFEAPSKATGELRRTAADLYRRGRIKSACAAQEELVRTLGQKATRDDFALLSLYHFSAGMEKAAADIIEEALERWPDDAEFLANIGISYLRANIFDKAESWLARAIAVSPEAPNLHDGLARLYMEKGDRARAITHGEKALVLKDEAAARTERPDNARLDVPPPGFTGERPERNILAFSLWGTSGRYLTAAVTNARLAPHIYPGWTARFYCEEGLPETVIADLLETGAQVIVRPAQSTLYEGLFWRFEPAFEDNVDRYIIRDADSVISVRERTAVEDWLTSGMHFHVMRDFLTHTDPMLAGLWGGTGGSLPKELQTEFAAYLSDPAKTANCDQKFLRERVWPIARRSCLVHDSHFQVLGAKPFPGGDAFGKDEAQRGHIGSSDHVRREFTLTALRGESETGTLRKRDKVNLVLSPCRALRENHVAALGERTVRGLPTTQLAADFQRDGNSGAVNAGWRRLAVQIRTGAEPDLAVHSDELLYSGLMENAGLICEDIHVNVVLLETGVADIAKSIRYGERLIDPDAGNRIVNPTPFLEHGDAGYLVWHAVESLTRMAFYRLRLSSLPNVRFVTKEAIQPLKRHASPDLCLEIDRIAATLKQSPTALAERFALSGGWLG